MRATALDKPAARLMGINVDGIISLTFALGAALAGAAGVLYAIAFPQIWTFMGIMPGLKAFVAAVLGGIGNIPGAFVGSLLMGEIDVLVVSFVPMGSRLRDLFAFLILIIVFLVKPTGIFGEPRSRRSRRRCRCDEDAHLPSWIPTLVVAVLPVSGGACTPEQTDMITAYWYQVIQLAALTAISALGLNLIYGFNGQFSLGHIGFYAIGAYGSALITKDFTSKWSGWPGRRRCPG